MKIINRQREKSTNLEILCLLNETVKIYHNKVKQLHKLVSTAILIQAKTKMKSLKFWEVNKKRRQEKVNMQNDRM